MGVPDHRTLVAWKFGSTITKIVRSLTSCWFECMIANELTPSAPHTSAWHPARAQAARTMSTPPSELAAATSAPKFLSSRHETALCSSLTGRFHYPLTAQANNPPRQTSKCSSWVDGGLFATWVGFTSHLLGLLSHPQQLRATQAAVHWWQGS